MPANRQLISLTERQYVFTDLETTGADWRVHEIIEVGAVITDPDFTIISEIDVKVKPLHIERADPYALEYNGYTEEAWRDAADLRDVLVDFRDQTENCLFVANNPTFDKTFIDKAYRDLELVDPEIHFQCIDIFTLGWYALRHMKPDWITQDDLAERLAIPPEPRPHRAINGARLAHRIVRRLVHDDIAPHEDILL